ncbi:MAG: SET domain-containing protein-lysine N-methyltransferase [Gammaproteobacteria bacterium]|nr:SET domain-containing protein-lysine N-methyltransferase [Gammaproteobacteria bacterium]
MSSSVSKQPLIKVRNSRIHGRGVFAARRIRKGTRIIEYLGERLSHQAADERYEDSDPNDNHTFLFIVDKKTVIDAGVGGNDARFINHSCDGNCESVIEKGRVWIEAARTIQPGEELGYDYEIGREPDDPENVDEIFACRCGSPKCRGTMLWPPERPEARAKPTQQAAKQGARRTADKPAGKSTRRNTRKNTREAAGKTARGTAGKRKSASPRTARTGSRSGGRRRA